ncbi:calcium-binding protein [Amaricoccus sp. W119]|uniref:calcium-binding protein n=1 Tax=Amaricoccus sp. W119 TaxID=3391833 RepID=UPI0039A40F83
MPNIITDGETYIGNRADGIILIIANDVTADGDAGDDLLTARIETSNVWIEEYPTAAVNTIEGGGGDDRITGVVSLGETFDETGEFRSELYGREGDDLITARGGFDNILVGNQDDDTLRGSGSTDRLIGGQGADVLSGGGGADEFVFEGPRGETSERDQILAFTQGEDKFDISAIDANVFQGGNQRFSFDDGTGSGHAWVEEDPDSNGSLLYADNGRGVLVVSIRDGGMDASDYEASDFLL